MEDFEEKELSKKNNDLMQIFPVPLSLNEIKDNIYLSANTTSQPSEKELISKAFKYHSKGNIVEAAKYYKYLINKGCIEPMVLANYGGLLRDLGNPNEATIYLQKATELKHDCFEAHYNLANTFRDINKLQKAVASYRKAITLQPNNALAHSGLGLTLLSKSEYNAALDCFAKSCNLLRGERKENDTNQSRIFEKVSKAKIDHDVEQFEYLSSKGIETEKFNKLAILYRKVSSEINWPSETQLIHIDEKYQRLLKNSYNILLHRGDTPKLNVSAINDSLNAEEISDNYFEHDYGLTYIDDFLSSTAIDSLRKFVLESTIWFSIKRNGYLGAFANEGFFSPLLIQIATELRNKFPRILKNHELNQIWAFKYNNQANEEDHKGINIHADFAAVNLNFWITSSEANLDPESGGLIVYDVEAPKEWDFKTFNNDERKIQEELKKSKGNKKVIPYKGNRAVLFNSNLFHETDKYKFKKGYENRRINITMLFGNRTTN